jgi:hypothetical protein
MVCAARCARDVSGQASPRWCVFLTLRALCTVSRDEVALLGMCVFPRACVFVGVVVQGKSGPITIDQYDVLHGGRGAPAAAPVPAQRTRSGSYGRS